MQGEFYVPNARRSNKFCLMLFRNNNAEGLDCFISGFFETA